MNYHHPPHNTKLDLDCDLIGLWEMGINFDPHDTIMLWYDVGENRFIDGDMGNVIHNIHQIIEPWKVALFRKKKVGMIFPDVTNKYLVELVYPDYMYIRHS